MDIGYPSGVGYPELRSDDWLRERLDYVWREHFSDIEQVNPVEIRFGRRARQRLGSISIDRHDQNRTVIRVTGWFRYREIPEFMIDSVIVHELCHYAHGFHSGREKQQKHPHAGGVVRREFSERGLRSLYDRQQEWLRVQWPIFLAKYYRLQPKKRRRRLSFFG